MLKNDEGGFNGRLLSNARAIESRTYKQQAYELIKDAILYRSLKDNTVYSQDSICNELHISRTPVREALLELQKEGYITFLRGRGIKLVSVSEAEILDILETRFLIEISGARLAALRAEPEDIENLRVTLEQMKSMVGHDACYNLYRNDRTFHRYMFLAAKNNWMAKTIGMLRDRYMRFDSWRVFDDEEGGNHVVQEHTRIMRAIAAHEEDEAEAAMSDHLKQSYKRNVTIAYDSIFEVEHRRKN